MFNTIKVHNFKKVTEVYLNPTYIMDDGKYKILSRDRKFGDSYKRVYIVMDENDKEVTYFNKLKEAKIFFGTERI